MASRPELVQMMGELGLDHGGLTIEQMTQVVRGEADKRWADKSYKISADGLSDTLRKFIVEEYDYVIKDREGKIKLDK